MFSSKAHADGDIEAVEMLWALMTLRYCDVYWGRQKDGDVHRDHRPGSVTCNSKERSKLHQNGWDDHDYKRTLTRNWCN